MLQKNTSFPSPDMNTNAMAETAKDKINTREIWSLTWPQALMMLFQFLIGFTNIFVAGRIDSTVQAAMGIIAQCLFILLVVGVALANGGVAAMSQALGAKLPVRASRYVGLLFKIGLGFCIFACFASYFFREGLFYLIQVPPHIYELTEQLWVMMIFVIPGQYLTTMSAAIFRSRKNVWVPFIFGFIVAVASVLGSLCLGLGYFGGPVMGAKGIVYADIIAIYLGVLFNVIMLVKKGILSRVSFSSWRWERRALPYIAKVALPSGGIQVVWQLGYVVLFSITNTLPGNEFKAAAGLTAGLRMESVMFLPTMAFSATASILVGQCLGGGDREEAKRVALRVIAAGVAFMTVVGIGIFPFASDISTFIAPDKGVSEVATSYLRYSIFSAPFSAISMIVSGIMTGAGATIYTFMIFSCTIWIIRLPCAYLLGHYIMQGPDGVFAAMLISQVAQAIAVIYVLTRCDWYRFASTAKRFKH